jgi:hypothetical protein
MNFFLYLIRTPTRIIWDDLILSYHTVWFKTLLRSTFTDPRADVILITEDGVEIRVESYYLMASRYVVLSAGT